MSLRDYLQNKPEITCERVTLRPLRPSDADALRTWTPDKALYAYWGKRPGKGDLHPELLFQTPKKPSMSLHLGIARKGDDFVMGEIYVYLIEGNRMAKVAFRVGRAYQGQGYATEALRAAVDFCFKQTELKRLWSDVDVRNTASVRVLEKCGFQREGMIRQGKSVSVWCDYYLYGLLKTDLR